MSGKASYLLRLSLLFQQFSYEIWRIFWDTRTFIFVAPGRIVWIRRNTLNFGHYYKTSKKNYIIHNIYSWLERKVSRWECFSPLNDLWIYQKSTLLTLLTTLMIMLNQSYDCKRCDDLIFLLVKSVLILWIVLIFQPKIGICDNFQMNVSYIFIFG